MGADIERPALHTVVVAVHTLSRSSDHRSVAVPMPNVRADGCHAVTLHAVTLISLR